MQKMLCEKCGKEFTCSADRMDQDCWCKSLQPLKPIPTEYKNCLCPDCLKEYEKSED
jgi:hypothetical protein